MPDWFYQPIYKPVVTHLLRAEEARQLTLFAMGVQSRFAVGRRIFDLLSRTSPPIVIPDTVGTNVFGLSFPTAIGLAHGIDIEAHALPLWSMLGLGFVQIGVLDIEDKSGYLEDTQVLPQLQAIISHRQASTDVNKVIARLRNHRDRAAPVGVALSSAHVLETLVMLEADANFFSIPCEIALHQQVLNDIRALTKKPVLIRVKIMEDSQLDRMILNAVDAGFDGCIVMDGQDSDLIEDGLIYGAHLREKALVWVARISEQYGDRFPVIGSGGILTPDDALAFLDAGAKLVQVYEGLVYAGPGLPRRILQKMLHPEPAIDDSDLIEEKQVSGATFGWKLILFVGFMLIMAGLLGILWASFFQLLPYELNYMQMSIPELSSYFEGRLAGFIFHDRVSYHGTLITYGILYSWMALYPLHPSRREAWAWWALFISGTVGAFSTYISYAYSAYLDMWVGSAALLLVSVFYVGLIFSYRSLKQPKNLRSLFKVGSRIWLWSPAGIGRSYLLFWSLTTALAGLLVFQKGMTQVFVKEDLAFMQTSIEAIQVISPRLIPFIAHDRIGFGVTMFAIGFAALAIVWKGIRPDSKSALIALLLAFLAHNLTAIWVHPIVGYNSFSHLLPFLVKDTVFLFALFHLYRPVLRTKPHAQFSDV